MEPEYIHTPISVRNFLCFEFSWSFTTFLQPNSYFECSKFIHVNRKVFSYLPMLMRLMSVFWPFLTIKHNISIHINGRKSQTNREKNATKTIHMCVYRNLKCQPSFMKLSLVDISVGIFDRDENLFEKHTQTTSVRMDILIWIQHKMKHKQIQR